LGEILPGVIHHLTRPQRFHQFQVYAAAHPGHLGSEVAAGKLHRIRADRAGSAVDQDFLPRLEFSLFEALPGRLSCARNGGGFGIAKMAGLSASTPFSGRHLYSA